MAINIPLQLIIESILVLGIVGFMCSLFIHVLDRKTSPQTFHNTQIKLGRGNAWIQPL